MGKTKVYPERLNARVSIKEKEKIKELVLHSGTSESEIIRSLIFNPKRNFISKEILLQIMLLKEEINKIGTNINQIAKNNNSGLYNPQDKEYLVFLYKEVNKNLQKIIEITIKK